MLFYILKYFSFYIILHIIDSIIKFNFNFNFFSEISIFFFSIREKNLQTFSSVPSLFSFLSFSIAPLLDMNKRNRWLPLTLLPSSSCHNLWRHHHLHCRRHRRHHSHHYHVVDIVVTIIIIIASRRLRHRHYYVVKASSDRMNEPKQIFNKFFHFRF